MQKVLKAKLLLSNQDFHKVYNSLISKFFTDDVNKRYDKTHRLKVGLSAF